MKPALIAFIGPSLTATAARAAAGRVRLELRGPARQGDIWRALDEQPAAIALIDGVFESVPAVWHHELRAALASGVPVFGAASMGALRAAELWRQGMLGIGRIFEWYREPPADRHWPGSLEHHGAEAHHDHRPPDVAHGTDSTE